MESLFFVERGRKKRLGNRLSSAKLKIFTLIAGFEIMEEKERREEVGGRGLKGGCVTCVMLVW